MRKRVVLIRIQALLATGVIAVFSTLSLPAFAQEAEEEGGEEQSVLVESTIVGDVDPTTATTVEDLTVAVEELTLLVKPLTLEELQIEAAAWFLILKNKVTEITETEIAIRRGNLAINSEEEARQAALQAQENLTEAEAALEAASPNTEEYEQAFSRVEEAKQALTEAEQAIETAVEAKLDLEEDTALQETIEEAEANEDITASRRLLEQAREVRDGLTAGSVEYNAATEQIDALDQALLALEEVNEALEAAIPGSAEYNAAEATREEARAAVLDTATAISDTGLVSSEAADEITESEEPEVSLEDISADIEAAESEIEGETGVAAGGEELEGVAEQLEESAEETTEIKNQLVVNVTRLQGEQTSIIDRFNIVLDELERKGGDITSYQKYIDAVTAINIDVTDTEGLGLRLLSWLRSDEGGVRWGLNVLKFISILLVSLLLARVFAVIVRSALTRVSGISTLFRGFLVTAIERGVLVIGFLVAITSLGISLGPLLALFGGVSFILAFALQSNLGNFASGLMLLFYKPFDVGDRVMIPGTSDKGYVREITLANTSFDHYTGKIVTIPNSEVWGSRIENLLPGEERLIEFLFMISSNDDARIIKESWERATESHPGISTNKWNMTVPFISPSSGALMYWCGAFAKKKGFWDVYSDIFFKMTDDFKRAGLVFGVDKHQSTIQMVQDNTAMASSVLSDLRDRALANGGEGTVPSSDTPETAQKFIEPDGDNIS